VEAERLYRRALATFERKLGPRHYEVAVNLSNLALLRRDQGEGEEADRLYRRAAGLKRRLLGAGHPDLALTLHNWAVLCRERGRASSSSAPGAHRGGVEGLIGPGLSFRGRPRGCAGLARFRRGPRPRWARPRRPFAVSALADGSRCIRSADDLVEPLDDALQ